MSYTTDPSNPGLTRGGDTEKTSQAKVYLVLSDEEIKKGFVRPLRYKYVHVGKALPSLHEGELEDLSAEDIEHYKEQGWVALFKYKNTSNGLGKMCTQIEVDHIKQAKANIGGCNSATTMGEKLAETYATQPGFYGYTYCVSCSKHLPVEEFIWNDGSRVGS